VNPRHRELEEGGGQSMQSLILKIFLAYWFAAAIVIIIADFGPHWPVHNPELAEALNGSLAIHGRALIHAYESGTCASALANINTPAASLYLATPDGHIVCGNLQGPGIQKIIAHAVSSHRLTFNNDGSFQFIAVPIATPGRLQYVLIVKNHNRFPAQVYRHLPGSTSIAISGVVTVLLAVLVVYPIRRLRHATHQIAGGALDTRLKTGPFLRLVARLHLRDDIDGLMADFNAMAGRLQSLVAAQKLLLRDVSHELRSPLARLALALEMAREADADALSGHLDRIDRESMRLNGLIAQILAFSYIESISELRHVPQVSLNGLVQDLLPDIQYEAESRPCRIVKTSSREVIICGDAEMLRHALENVVRNAIRYSPPHGTVEINIDTKKVDGRPTAILRVTDTGPGVSPEKLELILNPFYRAEGSRRGSTNGFGVGLAIADRAAHLHSGWITASNREGGGLMVELCLPLPS
jgi:two-component system sensor histidine kinase CpxA